MIRKLLVVLILVATLAYLAVNKPYYPPPPTLGILYGNIIQSEPITVAEATATLSFARNIHQYYLNRPWLMNSATGGAEWQQQWVDAYDDIIELINMLDANQGEERVITIIVTDEGIFVFDREELSLGQ